MRTITNRRLRLTAGAVAATAALALSGCGGSSGAPASATTADLTIVFGSNSASFSDLFVGVDQGIFARHGLNVKLSTLSGGATATMSALAGGHADMGYGQGSNIASAILQGGDYTVIGMTEAHYNLQLWTNPSITSPQQLKGKKVSSGQPGTESDQGWTAYLESQGMQRSDVTTVYTGGANTGQYTALLTNGVQGTLSTPPDDLVLRSKGFNLLGDLTNLPNATDCIVVSTSWLSTHQDVAERFLEAEKEAMDYVRANKAQTVTSIMKHTRSANEADASESYDFFVKIFTDSPVLDDEAIAALKTGFEEGAKKANKPAPSDITRYYKVIS